MASVSTVSVSDTFNASLLNNLVNTFQVPAGSTETGHYFLAGNAYATNAVVSMYAQSISNGITPASVTVDQADQAASGISPATPNTNHLAGSGCQVYSFASAAAGNVFVGGNITFQY